MPMTEMLYEGKAKQVFATGNPEVIIIHYKDDASAYNGIKRAQIANKGEWNNKISSIIYERLEKEGIKTHFIRRIDDRNQLCKRVKVIPIEVIVRNRAAGSMARRLGLPEGMQPKNTIYEYCYKNDELNDPLINEHHAVALGISTYEELDEIHGITERINCLLTEMFARIGVTLVDFKIEFGRTADGTLVLSDELSPDTCRLWDADTQEKLDKDRFRRDLGRVGEAYNEILSRLSRLD
ncbi:MAG: phosphoribosylaminoimidazolesuccinocarboxamide synthase [bacterium]|uniref:Phosphoribosylaminoimidazole-succinocarboxamide synthase n=1 Tax=Candidatus Aphodosoma intestinipullorum TaxID=2840674 RepID=A0A940DJF2_9BACT|nr:phosphoribosylaminoimidazolesuccinocarboxamide synthase [Candidatus Aphodosoma intestinipullorum]